MSEPNLCFILLLVISIISSFIILLLVIVSLINLAVTASVSMLLVKVFDIVRENEERRLAEEELRRKKLGLVNVETPQIPYNM